VPCGVADPRYGVTSLRVIGVTASMADVDDALRLSYAEVYGPSQPVPRMDAMS
ncbi:MAG: lipB, partial [Tardiphaga sp.]|nr:lipB [Tardiphaga sp.]